MKDIITVILKKGKRRVFSHVERTEEVTKIKIAKIQGGKGIAVNPSGGGWKLTYVVRRLTIREKSDRKTKTGLKKNKKNFRFEPKYRYNNNSPALLLLHIQFIGVLLDS